MLPVGRRPVLRRSRCWVLMGLAGLLSWGLLGAPTAAQDPPAPTPAPPPVPGDAAPAAEKEADRLSWYFSYEAWDGLRFEVRQSLPGKDPFADRPNLDLSQLKVTGRFGGRLGLDAAALGDLARPGEEPWEVRRLAVYMKGDLVLLTPFSYHIELSGVSGHFTTEDTYLLWRNLPLIGTFKVGQYKVQFGLENTTPSFSLVTMESASPITALAPGANAGVQVGQPVLKGRMSWTLGAFTQPNYQVAGDASEDYLRVTGRVTGLAVDREGGESPELLHLGLSASVLKAGQGGIEYRSRPEAHLAPYLVDTGNIPDGEARTAALECAWVKGPFSVQSELLVSQVHGPGQPTALLSGVYGMVTWTPTGESRPYDRANGTLTSMVPLRPFSFKHGGRGALELALRLSRVDLDDGPVRGGRMSTVTGAANWYLNRNAKLMLNVVHGTVAGPTPFKTINLVECRIAINI